MGEVIRFPTERALKREQARRQVAALWPAFAARLRAASAALRRDADAPRNPYQVQPLRHGAWPQPFLQHRDSGDEDHHGQADL